MKASNMNTILAGIQPAVYIRRRITLLGSILLTLGLLTPGCTVYAQTKVVVTSDICGPDLEGTITFAGIQDAKAMGDPLVIERGRDIGSAIKFAGIQDAMKSILGSHDQTARKRIARLSTIGNGQDKGSAIRLAGIQDAKRSVRGGRAVMKTLAARYDSRFMLADSEELEEAFDGNF